MSYQSLVYYFCASAPVNISWITILWLKAWRPETEKQTIHGRTTGNIIPSTAGGDDRDQRMNQKEGQRIKGDIMSLAKQGDLKERTVRDTEKESEMMQNEIEIQQHKSNQNNEGQPWQIHYCSAVDTAVSFPLKCNFYPEWMSILRWSPRLYRRSFFLHLLNRFDDHLFCNTIENYAKRGLVRFFQINLALVSFVQRHCRRNLNSYSQYHIFSNYSL